MTTELGWRGSRLRADGAALTLTVRCRDRRGSHGRRGGDAPGEHPVTLWADWTLDTGHDLDRERRSEAPGGSLSCLVLADQVLPAARGLWLARERREAPEIVPDTACPGHPGWTARHRAPRCECRYAHWFDAADAVEHLGSPEHWAARYDVPLVQLRAFHALVAAAVRPPAQVRIADWARADAWVLEPDGVRLLWRLGVPPEVVVAIHEQVDPGGDPLPLALYRDVVLRSTPREPADPAEPSERLRWLEAGAYPHDITDALRGARRFSDVRRIADATGHEVRLVTAVCAAWQRVGAHPDDADLAFLLDHAHVRVPRFAPEAAAGLVDSFRDAPDPPSHTQAALVLGAAGAVRIAETLLRHGVRSLSAADAIL